MLYLGADHAGYELKEELKKLFASEEIVFADMGTTSASEPADYPDFALRVAQKVAASAAQSGQAGQREQQVEEDLGVLVCGSGIGMDIAANKVKGIRAALATNEYMGRQAREHNDANILVLAGRITPVAEAKKIFMAFWQARFDQVERHARRVNKIKQFEQNNL